MVLRKKFDVVLLEEALAFLDSLDIKERRKWYYQLDKASWTNDPRLFKKLSNDIWEFRLLYGGVQYRLFAFWCKGKSGPTLVVCTHGMVKKTGKVPGAEIAKAVGIRERYWKQNR